MSDVLLVHGAWHGGWCWDAVREHLPDARTVDLPSVWADGDFTADVAAVRAALDEMRAPVTLVGHSYGGAVITEAGTHPNVGHLVYLTAFALDVGETVLRNAAPPSPPTKLAAAMRFDGDRVSLDPDGVVAAFFADCDDPPVDRLHDMSLHAFDIPVTTTAWRSVPSTYVVCTQDEAIDVGVQRFLATRCSNVVELDASHSPMLSMPGRVADLIRASVRSD
jgi:pimeloyl-ACP methyl ester carboxylesterase